MKGATGSSTSAHKFTQRDASINSIDLTITCQELRLQAGFAGGAVFRTKSPPSSFTFEI